MYLKQPKALPQTFFNRPAPLVARELLGKFLVRRYGKRTEAFMITETEAYEGFRDKASHAHRGQTKRNAPMFGDAGYWYVYFTYGMHWLLNIVTRERGYPSAVLIRAASPVRNSPRKNRLEAHSAGEISNGITGPAPLETGCRWQPPRQRRGSLTGPARLTKALAIGKAQNARLADRNTGLWIEDRGVSVRAQNIKTGARVGVAYAGAYWRNRKWRFRLDQKDP